MIRQFRILWGPTLENVLDFAWPVVGDAPRVWRQLREGTEIIQAPSATDVSITGRDYLLAVTAKWFDLSRATGATGLQAFIDWANNANAFTLLPDAALPALTVPGCFLVEPFADPSWSVEQGGEMTVDLVIRHPTQDLGLAWRGLFFEYVAGMSLTDPQTFIYSRANAGYETTWQGYLNPLANDVLGDGHYPTPLTTGLQTAVLQDAVTNDVTNPEDLSNASWDKTDNVSITVNNARAPDQAITADLIVENATPTVTHTIASNAFTIAAGDRVTALAFVRDGGRSKGRLTIGNAGQSTTFGVDYDLLAGTVSSFTSGSGVLDASRMTPLAGGWYMIWWRGQLDPATTTSAKLFLRLKDAGGSATYTGDGASGTYLWGATAVHGVTKAVSRYTPTTSVADNLSGPAGTTGLATPAATWAYAKFVELGSSLLGEADGRRIFFVGNSTPAFWVENAAGKYSANHHNGTTQATSGAGGLTAPAYGDVVELLMTIDATGAVQLKQSLNGGAEQSGTLSGAAAFATAWNGAPPSVWIGQQPSSFRAYLGIASVKIGPYDASITTVDAARNA